MDDGTPYFISVEEALTLCNNTPPMLRVEHVSLDDAHNRVLATTVVSTVNDPPFDNSSMDGFACQHQPDATYPLTLTIKGIQAATGEHTAPSIGPGEAVRIMTGAPMPPGADAILPIERCDVLNEREVSLLEQPKPHFVRKEGENLRKNESNLPRGTHLTPSRVGLCATMGHATLPVYQRLNIAIVSTGDELKPPGDALKHGEIYESNSYGLAGLVTWAGHNPIRFPSVSDSLEHLRATLNEAAATCDVILTSGGVSMGEFDYVRRLMEEEGEIHFWRMKIRPGSPLSSAHGLVLPCLDFPATQSQAMWCFACLSLPIFEPPWGRMDLKNGVFVLDCAILSSPPRIV